MSGYKSAVVRKVICALAAATRCPQEITGEDIVHLGRTRTVCGGDLRPIGRPGVSEWTQGGEDPVLRKGFQVI
jgi:hypothetical protein